MTNYWKYLVSAVILIFTAGGCSWTEIKFGSKKPQMSWVTITDSGAVQAGLLQEKMLPEGTNILGYVVTWPAEFNAAFVGPEGSGCIQPAAYVTTSSGTITTPTKLIANGFTEEEATAAFNQQITQLLKVSDEQTRLSIGMYGICQLVVADGLTQKQAFDALQQLLTNTNSVDTPESGNSEQEVSKENPLR